MGRKPKKGRRKIFQRLKTNPKIDSPSIIEGAGEPQDSLPDMRWLLEDPEEHQPLLENQAPDAAWARLTSTTEKGLGKHHPDGRRQSPKSIKSIKSRTGNPRLGPAKPVAVPAIPRAGTGRKGSTRHPRSRSESPRGPATLRGRPGTPQLGIIKCEAQTKFEV